MLFDRSGHSTPLTRRATCIGARAKSLLTKPGFSGWVLAVLPDVTYLSGKDGEILWLSREGAPLHGRGVLLPFPLQGLHSGEGFWVEGHSLRVGSDLAIDLGRAAEWRPDPLSRRDRGPLAGVYDRARQLTGAIAPNMSNNGPGLVIYGLRSILNGWGQPTFPPDSLQFPILSPVFDLMTHCLEEGLSGIDTRGRELIGLGPGLTPCGDDFLGGLFFTAHWVRETCPGKLPLERQSIVDLVQWARNRTHPISHALLGDLAIGEGPEPLHTLLGSLLKDGDLDGRTRGAVDSLLNVGHTTGWYMLAGLLTCLLSVEEKHKEDTAHLPWLGKRNGFGPTRPLSFDL